MIVFNSTLTCIAFFADEIIGSLSDRLSVEALFTSIFERKNHNEECTNSTLCRMSFRLHRSKRCFRSLLL